MSRTTRRQQGLAPVPQRPSDSAGSCAVRSSPAGSWRQTAAVPAPRPAMVNPLARPRLLNATNRSAATGDCPGNANDGRTSSRSTNTIADGTTNRKNDQKTTIWPNVAATWRTAPRRGPAENRDAPRADVECADRREQGRRCHQRDIEPRPTPPDRPAHAVDEGIDDRAGCEPCQRHRPSQREEEDTEAARETGAATRRSGI